MYQVIKSLDRDIIRQTGTALYYLLNKFGVEADLWKTDSLREDRQKSILLRTIQEANETISRFETLAAELLSDMDELLANNVIEIVQDGKSLFVIPKSSHLPSPAEIIKAEPMKGKKVSLREFLEVDTDCNCKIITSKINRIKAVDKQKRILPMTANNPTGNQTKLYYESDLIAVWPKLKDKIPTLPNLKNS